MKILMATPELAEVAPVGGIAEYVLGLAASLTRNGHDVKVAAPAYGFLRSRDDVKAIGLRLPVELGVGASEVTEVYETRIPCPGTRGKSIHVILLGEHKHFLTARSPKDVYSWPNHEPWIAFSRAIVDLLNASFWDPEVIHCQDSHTALIPVYVGELRKLPKPPEYVASVKVVLTIHNLLNQGVGSPGIVTYAGLPQSLFSIESFEFHGKANCLKAGLLATDEANTVSRTYAQEICDSEDFGFGLAGVLSRIRKEGKLRGIVSGIDSGRWIIDGAKYDGTDSAEEILRWKDEHRAKLYEAWDWEETHEPVFGFRGRWDNQKGVLILGQWVEGILEIGRLILCTWGTPGATGELRKIWKALSKLAKEKASRLLINPTGVDRVEQTWRHYAIANFMFMPSAYEPCGLVQMECQRYGTIPIVRSTGGLADTVSEVETGAFPSPNGFVFEAFDGRALEMAVRRAVEAFGNPERRNTLIRNCLNQKNDWDSRVAEYIAMYSR